MPESGEKTRERGTRSTKLSYKDQRELDGLPDEISALEDEVLKLQAEAAEPGFYTLDEAIIQEKLAALAAAERRVEERMERWAELESERDALARQS